ncbi:hypothetical protein CROQUDRAFT_666300 [Cronartium quercuum f. sp. fusiforme G11]|uniref:Uncharacterized protein n=1 Tax=Cronartium quercuum f. sp. fusiforme G11 TaxID=708437 RepID=A0A9P6T5E0_9BASI|nr:hypothetical protein CROQUDRAFT_666300 [Cronartium quercuum f. sp. fusiforme G11]
MWSFKENEKVIGKGIVNLMRLLAGGVHPQLGRSPQKPVVPIVIPGLIAIPVEVFVGSNSSYDQNSPEYKNITITARSKKEVDIILVGARSQALPEHNASKKASLWYRTEQ